MESWDELRKRHPQHFSDDTPQPELVVTPYVPEPRQWANKTVRPFKGEPFGPGVRFKTDDESISIEITRDLSAREVGMLQKNGFDQEQEGSDVWIGNKAEIRKADGDPNLVAFKLINQPDNGRAR